MIRHQLARLSHGSGASTRPPRVGDRRVRLAWRSAAADVPAQGAARLGYPIPVLIVQHIAAGFTEGLVDWLNQAAAVPVMLAESGIRAVSPVPGWRRTARISP